MPAEQEVKQEEHDSTGAASLFGDPGEVFDNVDLSKLQQDEPAIGESVAFPTSALDSESDDEPAMIAPRQSQTYQHQQQVALQDRSQQEPRSEETAPAADQATTGEEDENTDGAVNDGREVTPKPDGWDKERQKQDEADARAGLSKKDLLDTVGQLRERIALLEAARTQPATEAEVPTAPTTDAELELALLPEEDELAGPLDANIAFNKSLKAQFAQQKQALDALRKETEGLLAEREEAANRKALDSLVAQAASAYGKTDSDATGARLVNPILARLQNAAKQRGFNENNVPSEQQAHDLVFRIAADVALEEARTQKTAPPLKPSKQAAKSDAGKGGRPAPVENELPSVCKTTADCVRQTYAELGIALPKHWR